MIGAALVMHPHQRRRGSKMARMRSRGNSPCLTRASSGANMLRKSPCLSRGSSGTNMLRKTPRKGISREASLKGLKVVSRESSFNKTTGANRTPRNNVRVGSNAGLLPENMTAAELALLLTSQMEQDKEDNIEETWEDFLYSTKFLFGALWVVWLVIGAVAYKTVLDVSWAKGFYMAVNVGYSIGWGDVSEEGNSSSQWFSIFFVLCGSSFVAAALGFFAQSIVTDQDNWYTNELHRIAHEKYIEENKNNYALLVTGWIVFNFAKVRAIILWFAFIVISTGFAWATNEWSFREALYFSISSLSTGGLYPLPTGSPDWHYGLAAFYTAVGVPLMAVAMATLASFFISTGDLDDTLDQIREPITEEELEMLTDFEIADDDDVIDKSEFIILCMVRIGAATPELIKKIIEYYDELDVDGDGALETEEIIASAKNTSLRHSRSRSSRGSILGSFDLSGLTQSFSFGSSFKSSANSSARSPIRLPSFSSSISPSSKGINKEAIIEHDVVSEEDPSLSLKSVRESTDFVFDTVKLDAAAKANSFSNQSDVSDLPLPPPFPISHIRSSSDRSFSITPISHSMKMCYSKDAAAVEAVNEMEVSEFVNISDVYSMSLSRSSSLKIPIRQTELTLIPDTSSLSGNSKLPPNSTVYKSCSKGFEDETNIEHGDSWQLEDSYE